MCCSGVGVDTPGAVFAGATRYRTDITAALTHTHTHSSQQQFPHAHKLRHIAMIFRVILGVLGMLGAANGFYLFMGVPPTPGLSKSALSAAASASTVKTTPSSVTETRPAIIATQGKESNDEKQFNWNKQVRSERHRGPCEECGRARLSTIGRKESSIYSYIHTVHSYILVLLLWRRLVRE